MEVRQSRSPGEHAHRSLPKKLPSRAITVGDNQTRTEIRRGPFFPNFFRVWIKQQIWRYETNKQTPNGVPGFHPSSSYSAWGLQLWESTIDRLGTSLATSFRYSSSALNIRLDVAWCSEPGSRPPTDSMQRCTATYEKINLCHVHSFDVEMSANYILKWLNTVKRSVWRKFFYAVVSARNIGVDGSIFCSLIWHFP